VRHGDPLVVHELESLPVLGLMYQAGTVHDGGMMGVVPVALARSGFWTLGHAHDPSSRVQAAAASWAGVRVSTAIAR
jgi:hypothetical protein